MRSIGPAAGVIVRAARPDDAERIAGINIRSWRAAYAGIVPASILDEMEPIERQAVWLQRIERLGERTLLLAELNGRVEGYVLAGPARDHDVPELAGEIYAIYVDPPAQARGLGRLLLGAAAAELAARGFAPLVLWVLAANEAGRRFYAACGWRPDGGGRPIDFDGTAVDEVRYGPA